MNGLTIRRSATALLCMSALGLGAVGIASAAPAEKTTICHATGTPDDGGNGYVVITPSNTGVFNGHLQWGDDGEPVIEEGHEADIIPPFTYTDPKGESHEFPGQNWDAEGQDVWNGGDCAGDGVVPPTTPPTTTTTTEPTSTTSTTDPTGTTSTTEPTGPTSTSTTDDDDTDSPSTTATSTSETPVPPPGAGPSTPGVVQTDGGPMGSPFGLLALVGLAGAGLAAEITRRKLAYSRQH